MNKKITKTLVLSASAALMFGAVAVGTTYALFTSEADANVTVTAGKVAVKAEIQNLKLYSLDAESGEAVALASADTFTNGGSAILTDLNISLSDVTPGDKVTFDLKVLNSSNVKSKYRTIIQKNNDTGLFNGLVVTVGESTWSNGFTIISPYTELEPVSEETEVETLPITIDFPSDRDNSYQGKACDVSIKLEAVQGNTKVEEVNENALNIYSDGDFETLATLVNEGSSLDEYEEISLLNDINLDPNTVWTPIGQKEGTNKFTSIFDGNNHAINGLNVTAETANTEVNDGYGALFGAIDGDAVIKNLTVNGTVSCKNAAGIVARMNKGTIENCTSNVEVTGTAKTGGIVSLTNASGCVIKNCVNNGVVTGGNAGTAGIVGFVNGGGDTLIEDCLNTATIGSSTESYTGGIVGYMSGSKGVIKNSKNNGEIKGKGNTGGIVGLVPMAVANGGRAELANCENTGGVTSAEDCAGGIVGASNGTAILTSCKNSGNVTAKNIAGGVIGNFTTGEVTNCAGGTGTITALEAVVGRLIGQTLEADLSIDDENGDDYASISAIGRVRGPGTHLINVKAGTLNGNIEISFIASASHTKVVLANDAKWLVDGDERTGTWYGNYYTNTWSDTATYE